MGKVMLFIVGFLLLGGYMIYQGSHYDLDDNGDRKSFAKEFAKWVWDVGKKTKNVVAYVVHEDWLPDTPNNETENETQAQTDKDSSLVTVQLG